MPKRKKKKRDTEPISRKINDHVRSLGERINGRPKEAQQDCVITARMIE